MPTLADLESELARRTGPWASFTVAATPVSTATLVYASDLSTTIETGGYEGMWLLRRTAAPADRVRRVKTWDAGAGSFLADRPWAAAPTAGEVIEISALDPARRVATAVQRGLERCLFVDRLALPITAPAAERSLTATWPWLTVAADVLGVEAGCSPPSDWDPWPVGAWDAYRVGPSVLVAVWPDPGAGTLYVTALRPHSSLVNGLDSTTGPLTDSDTVSCTLDDGVAFAHAYLWDTAKDLLRPLVSEGLGTSEDDVRAAVRRYRSRLPAPRDRVVLPSYAVDRIA